MRDEVIGPTCDGEERTEAGAVGDRRSMRRPEAVRERATRNSRLSFMADSPKPFAARTHSRRSNTWRGPSRFGVPGRGTSTRFQGQGRGEVVRACTGQCMDRDRSGLPERGCAGLEGAPCRRHVVDQQHRWRRGGRAHVRTEDLSPVGTISPREGGEVSAPAERRDVQGAATVARGVDGEKLGLVEASLAKPLPAQRDRHDDRRAGGRGHVRPRAVRHPVTETFGTPGLITELEGEERAAQQSVERPAGDAVVHPGKGRAPPGRPAPSAGRADADALAGW